MRNAAASGQTTKGSPEALEQDVGLQDPIAEAIKRKRLMMAAKMNAGSSTPMLDSFGNPTIDPSELDNK